MPLKHDIFISYASEDKEVLAKPLALLFKAFHINVWFDEFELRVGDSLSEKIAYGLNNSKYGACIFSSSFLSKAWPKHELKGIITLLLENKMKILPVWLNISKKDIIKLNPSFGDLVAVKTDGQDVFSVFLQLLQVVNPAKYNGFLRYLSFEELASNAKTEKIDIKQLKRGKIQHETLPFSAISRSALICEVLKDSGLTSMNLEDFLDNLRRDVHYVNELKVWERIAYAYHIITQRYDLTLNQKSELVGFLLFLSSGMTKDDPEIKKYKKSVTDKIYDEANNLYVDYVKNLSMVSENLVTIDYTIDK